MSIWVSRWRPAVFGFSDRQRLELPRFLLSESWRRFRDGASGFRASPRLEHSSGLPADGSGAWSTIFLNQNYYEGINLGQWRGSFSLPIGECNEFGVWFTVPEHDDSATFLSSVVQLKPIGQANAFWRRTWETGGETTFWLGAARNRTETRSFSFRRLPDRQVPSWSTAPTSIYR